MDLNEYISEITNFLEYNNTITMSKLRYFILKFEDVMLILENMPDEYNSEIIKQKLDFKKIINTIGLENDDYEEDNLFCNSLLNCKEFNFCTELAKKCVLNSSFDKLSEIYKITSHGSELNEYFVIPPNVTIEVHTHGTGNLNYTSRYNYTGEYVWKPLDSDNKYNLGLKKEKRYYLQFGENNIIYNSNQIMRNIEFDFADASEISNAGSTGTFFYPLISDIDINKINDYSIKKSHLSRYDLDEHIELFVVASDFIFQTTTLFELVHFFLKQTDKPIYINVLSCRSSISSDILLSDNIQTIINPKSDELTRHSTINTYDNLYNKLYNMNEIYKLFMES